MPVIDAVIHVLEDEGTDVIFGVPGEGVFPFCS
jgi:thiamine pyrophosphate-dependent acetolactate synthase large subunit-like protein